jgi:cytochrome c553
MNRIAVIALAALTALPICAAATAADDAFVVPAWAYPGNAAQPADAQRADGGAMLQVPGSDAAFTRAQVTDLFSAPDWHPDTHPAMPPIVAQGRRPDVYACAYCHLPDGRGRPENAALAGLPVAYIIDQVGDFRSGERRSAWHDTWLPTGFMIASAKGATKGEIAAAAEYFASLPMKRHVEVVETAEVPKTKELGWLYVPIDGAGTEALGSRIIEVPLDHHLHELRDSASGFRAYVPVGSLARGRDIVEEGRGDPAFACTNCHGAGLHGEGLFPPLAGRSPSYIFRQLLAFRTGTRASASSRSMMHIVKQLDAEDMIAAAAYAASLDP